MNESVHHMQLMEDNLPRTEIETLEHKPGIIKKFGAVLLAGSITAALIAPAQEAGAQEYDPGAVVSTVEPLSNDPAVVGRWSEGPAQSDILAVHASLGYDESDDSYKLLITEGSGNDPNQFAAGTFRTAVWDLSTNEYRHVENVPTDMFCSIQTPLADGDTLIAGGTSRWSELKQNPGGRNFGGENSAYTFDYDTEQFVETAEPMSIGRWYPTGTLLGNGDVAILGGLDEEGRNTPIHEVYRAETRTFDTLPHQTAFPLYPSVFLRSDGRLFYSGAYSNFIGGSEAAKARIWNINTGATEMIPGILNPDQRAQSMGVNLAPTQENKFLIVGGGRENNSSEALNYIEVVDLDNSNLLRRFTLSGLLPVGVEHVSAVTLPDDRLMIVGGSRRYAERPVLQTVVFDHKNNSVETWEPHAYGRTYHSGAVLLPDARVALFGGNPNNGYRENRIEIFEPPYLFKGQRPEIESGPEFAYYGNAITIEANSAAEWKHFRLIRPMHVTHSTDTNQRSVDVPFHPQADGSIVLNIPQNPNLLPPGDWMLFAVDAQGRPSVAHNITIQQDPNPPQSPENPIIPSLPFLGGLLGR